MKANVYVVDGTFINPYCGSRGRRLCIGSLRPPRLPRGRFSGQRALRPPRPQPADVRDLARGRGAKDGGGDIGVLRPGVIQSADLTGLNPCFNKMIVDKPHTVEDNRSVPPSSSFGEPGAKPPQGGFRVSGHEDQHLR